MPSLTERNLKGDKDKLLTIGTDDEHGAVYMSTTLETESSVIEK